MFSPEQSSCTDARASSNATSYFAFEEQIYSCEEMVGYLLIQKKDQKGPCATFFFCISGTKEISYGHERKVSQDREAHGGSNRVGGRREQIRVRRTNKPQGLFARDAFHSLQGLWVFKPICYHHPAQLASVSEACNLGNAWSSSPS